MDDLPANNSRTILELRAWDSRGPDRVLVAERVRDQHGRRMIWHVPENELRSILWIEVLVEEEAGSSLD